MDKADIEKVWREFDSFEAAEAYTEDEQLKLTPEERIELCYKISIAGWEFHHGQIPEESIRQDPMIRYADLKKQGGN